MNILITDIDLDGLGCEVVARKVFGSDVKVKRVRYDTVGVEVRKALALNPDRIMIADMWIKDENGLYNELAAFKGQLMLFDHHMTSMLSQNQFFGRRGRPVLWLSDMHGPASKILEWHQWDRLVHHNGIDVCFNGEGNCSALKMRNYFNVDLPMINEVSTYDTTGTVEGLPGALNHLFYEVNRAHMREILNRDALILTSDEWNQVHQINAKHKTNFDTFKSTLQVTTIDEKRFAFIEVTESKSWIAQHLLKEYDYVIMVDKCANTVSIRSNVPGANTIAEKFGGGGHKQAAGFKGIRSFDEILVVCNEVL